MSCCGGNCGCGDNCGCGSGCKGCKMYPEIVDTPELSTAGSPDMGKGEQVTVAGEGGDAPSACSCNPCTCNPCNCK